MGIDMLERHLSLEHMRATVRHAVFTCGNPRLYVASRAGVSRVTLMRLLEGGDLAHPTWRGLWTWCEEWGWEPAYAQQAALSVLVSELPRARRLRARESLVRWLRYHIVKDGQPVPDWVENEMEALRTMRYAHRRGRGRTRR
jgi:hypothetical protein